MKGAGALRGPLPQADQLMPSNHNFVCFDCRVNVRRSKLAEMAPLCPACGRECASLGYKMPIPSKEDLAAWKRLSDDFREAKRHLVMVQDAKRVALTHEIERKLKLLELQPKNPGRERAIRDLKRRLDDLTRPPS